MGVTPSAANTGAMVKLSAVPAACGGALESPAKLPKLSRRVVLFGSLGVAIGTVLSGGVVVVDDSTELPLLVGST